VKKKRSDGTYITEITKTTMKRDGSCSIVREIKRYDSLEHQISGTVSQTELFKEFRNAPPRDAT
jgi:hypothetical protein